MVRHEILIPDPLKKWLKKMKKEGYGSESVITVTALNNLRDSMGK